MSTQSVDAILVVIAPELASLSQEARYAAINVATTMVGFGCGGQKDLAIAYLTAHILTIGQRGNGNTTGSVTSKKEGDLAISYGNSNGNAVDPYYGQTSYGLAYQNMISSLILSPVVRQWKGDNCCG